MSVDRSEYATARPRFGRPVHRHRPAAAIDVDRVLRELADGPVDRRTLALRTHWPDRRVRRAIEEARLRGQLVVILDGAYRIAASAEEFETWALREQRSRLGTLHAQLSAMTRTAQRQWPAEQIRLAL